MIISRDDKLVNLCSSDLLGIKSDFALTLGFDFIKFEVGQLMIYIELLNPGASIEHPAILNALVDVGTSAYCQCNEQESGIIVIESYKSTDISPIIKLFKFSSDSIVEIVNTFFSGVLLNVSLHDGHTIKLVTDSSEYVAKLTQDKKQMMILNQGLLYAGLPYDADRQLISSWLTNEGCGPYLNVNWCFNALSNASSYLKDDLVQLMFNLEKTKAKVGHCFIDNQLILVTRTELENGYVDYSLKRESNLLSLIDYLSYAYRIDIEKSIFTKTAVNPSDYFPNVAFASSKMMLIQKNLIRAAASKINILITGESGTGKSLLAKEIHMKSKRSSQSFIEINCAAIPVNLIESELFGYEEGAFTGASKHGRKGYFEQANHGTLFLDEIGELSLSAQVRLLEVLQTNSFFRVGGNKKITVDVRIIAATNCNLEELVCDKQFRNDLFYRLSVFPIHVPPLRERMEDLEPICKRLIPKICTQLEVEPVLIDHLGIQRLKNYLWPGNVRELENMLARAIILCDKRILSQSDFDQLGLDFQQESDYPLHYGDLSERLEYHERQIIEEVLHECDGHPTLAARVLGIGRTTLFEKMKKYSLGRK